MKRKVIAFITAILLACALVPNCASAATDAGFTRRISRINEYDSKGVTKAHTFRYNQEGTLASYTTRYYESGKVQRKDEWVFDYYDDGSVFTESMTNEKDRLDYYHVRLDSDEENSYQVFYGHGIQQQFYYKKDKAGKITKITGEGIHDYLYESEMLYAYDDEGQLTTCAGTLSKGKNAKYEITKTYDTSYPGVVIVEENNTLNGSELPVRYYLRVDMPEYISIPEVVFYAGDEIKTDKDGYITKLIDKNGALRCELYFDWIKAE